MRKTIKSKTVEWFRADFVEQIAALGMEIRLELVNPRRGK